MTYYNGETHGSKIPVTLTGVPNILSEVYSTSGGSYAKMQLTFNNASEGDRLIINGITFTYNYSSSNGVDIFKDRNTLIQCLRNSSLAVNYNIYRGERSNVLIVEAKEVGYLYNITFEKITSSSSAFTAEITRGSSAGDSGHYGDNYCIDLYTGGRYVTSLLKKFYKQKVDFNVSDVLTSISNYEVVTPYLLRVGFESDTSFSLINGYSIMGYMCNQGKKYFYTTDKEAYFALNVSRGGQPNLYNQTVLYTYLPSITFVSYNEVGTIGIDYLDSAKHSIRSEIFLPENSSGFQYHTVVIPLTTEYFNEAYYIDLYIPNVGTVRYNVIKPLDATSRCQRIYWHNSYGGISFFDFTGKMNEEHKTSKTTYTKNVFDYYTDNTMEQTKVYGNDISVTVTLESHLMERSAVWLFNDLLSAYDVWTTINGLDYKIIILTVKCDETDTGVWKAVVTYTYSLI